MVSYCGRATSGWSGNRFELVGVESVLRVMSAGEGDGVGRGVDAGVVDVDVFGELSGAAFDVQDAAASVVDEVPERSEECFMKLVGR